MRVGLQLPEQVERKSLATAAAEMGRRHRLVRQERWRKYVIEDIQTLLNL